MAHLEALPLATWIGNPGEDCVFANQALRSLLGVRSVDEIANGRWSRHIHPGERKTYVAAWRRFVGSSEARFRQTVRWTRPDTGKTIKLAVRAQRLKSGQLQGWVRIAVMEDALSTLEGL
jgi:PAS domain-containing protein